MHRHVTLILKGLHLFAAVSLFSACLSPAMATIDKEQASQIIASVSEPGKDFRGFLGQLATTSSVSSEIRAVSQRFLAGETLTAEQSNTLYRLLGLYSRIKYGDAAIATLAQLVAIPTFRDESVPQHENPNFLRFAATLEAIAAEFKLAFRNIDDRVYEVSLEGSGNELVGIHAHADVVPANPALWVLEDGTRLDPFELTLIGDRLYGRGAQDDKNGIVVVLYAMRTIQEENLPLLRDFRLLVDTTEETGGTAIPYYFERNPTPNFNIALDGSYPLIIAEKGFGTVTARFPVRAGSGEGAELLSLTGGLATNEIPAASVAEIATTQPQKLVALLNQKGSDYVATHGDDFTVNASVSGKDSVRLEVYGVSAHSSEPENGVNPVARMLDFLNSFRGQGVFQDNHITDAARYGTDNWGLDYLGNNLGVAYSDSFMGPLTACPTFVGLDAVQLSLAVNLRLPVGREPENLRQELATRLDAWALSTETDVSLDVQVTKPMFRNPEGNWVVALLDVATENLGMARKLGSSAGGTSVHDLPNGVQFGLAMPGIKYTGHNINEFKSVNQFLLDLQITTEMLARIGSMPAL